MSDPDTAPAAAAKAELQQLMEDTVNAAAAKMRPAPADVPQWAMDAAQEWLEARPLGFHKDDVRALARIIAKHAPVAAAGDVLADLREQRDGWKREADRLRLIAQEQVATAAEGDAWRDVLRRIDKMFGCDHAERSPEDCDNLVRHVRELQDQAALSAPQAARDARIRLTVNDPDGMISHLSVVHESPDAVLIYGDMNSPGKRASVYWYDHRTFHLVSDPERGHHEAEVKINGLPEGVRVVCDDVSRYTLFLAFTRDAALLAAREEYRESDGVIPARGEGRPAGEDETR